MRRLAASISSSLVALAAFAANAQDATLVVGERLGTSSRYIGTSYDYDPELFEEAGFNTYFWGNSGPSFEPVNDSGCARGPGCWGTPTPAAIKADANEIPWAAWDGAVESSSGSFEHAKSNGIAIVMGLRSHAPNSSDYWMANPPENESDWNEWWAHVFAVGYTLNVRNDWRVDHYQLENEPDRNDGYLGSIAHYLEETRVTYDALQHLYATYLPGRSFHLAVPSDSWAGSTDNPRMSVPDTVNGDDIRGSWLLDSIRNAPEYFNSVAVHTYGPSDGMAGWLQGRVKAPLAEASLDYPLWVTEWGGDSTDGGRDIVDLMLIFSRPESHVLAHHFFYTAQLRERDYKYHAMALAARALRGSKPTFEVSSSHADVTALVTRETGGATYLVATNKSFSAVSVEGDFGALGLAVGPTVLSSFDGTNAPVTGAGPTLSDSKATFTLPPNGAAVLQIGDPLDTPGGIDPGADGAGASGGAEGGGAGGSGGSGGVAPSAGDTSSTGGRSASGAATGAGGTGTSTGASSASGGGAGAGSAAGGGGSDDSTCGCRVGRSSPRLAPILGLMVLGLLARRRARSRLAAALGALSVLAVGCTDEGTDAARGGAESGSGGSGSGAGPAGAGALPATGGTQQTPTDPMFGGTSGSSWEDDYTAALARAATEQKAVFVMMSRPGCPNTAHLAADVLASAQVESVLAERFVPVLLNLDVINVETVRDRAGRPELAADVEADQTTRLGVKVALSDAVFDAGKQPLPPLLGVFTASGELIDARAGVIGGDELLALLREADAAVPAAFEPPATPGALPPTVHNPFEVDKGTGAIGEALDGAGLSTLPDPYPLADGQTTGLGGYACVFGGKGRTNVSQIVLSATLAPSQGRVTFSNPPLLVDWSSSGEGIQYHNPVIPDDVEDVDYRRHANVWTVMTSPGNGTLTILGTPPAHRHYNGTVRVGRGAMGVVMSFGDGTSHAFVVSPTDGTLAAVYLDAENGETAGDRVGETVYFDAASGARLDSRSSAEQIIDSEGRGGGQEGFGAIPGEPGPVSDAAAALGPEDVAIHQEGDWPSGADRVAYLFVSNSAAGTVSVFDAKGFLDGSAPDLTLIGRFDGIENPRKLAVNGGALWVGNNPGSSVTRIDLENLPAIEGAEKQVITVGKDPMYMAWIWHRGILAVANSGDDSVSLVKDGREVIHLDSSNSAPLKQPYGIHAWDGSRLIVANFGGENATYWNLKMNPESDTLEDLVINSWHVFTGPGVTSMDGDYIP